MESIDKLGRLIWWAMQNWRLITWARVNNFLEAKYRQHNAGDWVMEQFDWRHKQVASKSPECILSGACVDCGCETPDKFFETMECERGCYPEWMNEQEWKEFKNKQ